MKKIYKRGTLICTLLIMLMCFAGLYFENNRANATYSQLKSVPETTEGIAPRSSVTQGGEVLKINGTKRDLELKSITDFTDVKFIPNAYYFVSNPMHAKNKQEYNSNGTCTTIAVQMLIGYHNYYSDRRILPVAAENYKFLDTIYGKKIIRRQLMIQLRPDKEKVAPAHWLACMTHCMLKPIVAVVCSDNQ